MNLDYLKVSDETGEAVLANVDADRSVSATTLVVDSVDNWPQEFIFVTGDKVLAPNGVDYYVDPSTMTVMRGHLDSGDIIIDGFAPGYSDAGNTNGQIAIIKPTTYWADEIVALFQVMHNNDGTLKDWVTTNETWTYSAWDATSRIAQITVPTDATTKYQEGQRVKFDQTTDGTKYGIIHKVEATTLHVFLPVGTDFDNETISNTYFSSQYAPFGFDTSGELWFLDLYDDQASISSPASSPTNIATLAMPVGGWVVELTGSSYVRNSGTTGSYGYTIGVSATTAAVDDDELTATIQAANAADSAVEYKSADIYKRKNIKITTAADWYLVYDTSGSAITNLYFGTGSSTGLVRLTSAYI